MKPHKIVTLSVMCISGVHIYAQCCAGGSGSPIAGGASQGVLQERQMEISSNFQYINTDKFYKEDKPDTSYFDGFHSNYVYTRLGYGITKNLTMSVESGYWINKTQIGLYKIDTISSSGFGDLILFPRYDILNRTDENKRTEITFGLGVKIPLGSYNDSTKHIEPFSGEPYYITKPLAVQTSSGSHDIIFYSFFFRGYPLKNFRLFSNVLYIRKGWNPIGEKIGDYASIGLFAGTTLFRNLGFTFQVKGEWVDKMKINKDILLYHYPNYDPEATGSKKVFIAPQISYTLKNNFTIYAMTEIPVYQYVVKTQVASQYQFTMGISYRFFTTRSVIPGSDGEASYVCPMKCQPASKEPGQCRVCGMDLKKLP